MEANSFPRHANNSFFELALGTHVDFLVAFGMATPLNRTWAVLAEAVLARLLAGWTASVSASSMGSMMPIGLASVVKWALRFLVITRPGDFGSSLIVISRGRWWPSFISLVLNRDGKVCTAVTTALFHLPAPVACLSGQPQANSFVGPSAVLTELYYDSKHITRSYNALLTILWVTWGILLWASSFWHFFFFFVVPWWMYVMNLV